MVYICHANSKFYRAILCKLRVKYLGKNKLVFLMGRPGGTHVLKLLDRDRYSQSLPVHMEY
jgi:hypothetical protein